MHDWDDIPDWWSDLAPRREESCAHPSSTCGPDCDAAIERHRRYDIGLAILGVLSAAIGIILILQPHSLVVLALSLWFGVPIAIYTVSKVWLWWTLRRIHLSCRQIPTGTRKS